MYPSFGLSVCLFVWVHLRLSICRFFCLSVSVCPSVRPFVCHCFIYVCLSLFLCLSVRLSVRPSVCLSVRLSVCLSVRLSVCLSLFYLFVCLSLCFSVSVSACLSVCVLVSLPFSPRLHLQEPPYLLAYWSWACSSLLLASLWVLQQLLPPETQTPATHDS